MHSENKIRSFEHQLIQEKANKQNFKQKYDAAKSIAVSKVGSIHEVQTAIFTAQHPVQRAKVSKLIQPSTSAFKTVQHSDEDSSCDQEEFGGMNQALESDENDPVPVSAEVAFAMMDGQTAKLVQEKTKAAMHVHQHKQHRLKKNSVLRNSAIMRARTPAPIKSTKQDNLDDS